MTVVSSKVSKMTDIVDLEEAMQKTGPELFKELYRANPEAEAEDYFKGGQWRNDLMKTDLILLESHRREAGAPDVPDLDDIKLPKNMPQQIMPAMSTIQAGGLGLRPAGAGLASLQAGAAAAGSAPVVEIRLIALFVAKWKLEPVKSKSVLAKLTPARRRYVIQNFKTETTGAEATTELETYIAECEVDGSWDKGALTPVAAGAAAAKPAGAAVAPAKAGIPKAVTPPVSGLKTGLLRPAAAKPGGPVAPAIVGGLKRPLTPAANPAFQQNKRPMLGGATPTAMVRPQGAMVRPPGAKATGATVRPPLRPAGAAKGGGKLMNSLLSGF